MQQFSKQTYREQVAHLIRQRIRNGKLKGGDCVGEAGLAEECGISRAPVREALYQLEAEGLLMTHPKRGKCVTILTPDGIRMEEPVFVESVMVDGKGVGDVGYAVLKERRILGDEGMVIVVLVVDSETGSILHGPEMISKGFVFEQHYSHLLEDAKCLVLDEIEAARPGQINRLQENIRSSLRRFFRRVLERDPIVVPVISEV